MLKHAPAVLLGVVFLTWPALPASAAPAARPPDLDAHLHAIVDAARTGDAALIRAAVDRYLSALQNAVREMRGCTCGLGIAAQRVREATRKHLEVLRSLPDRVPEQARPAIEHAIEVASRGHKEATEALERAREESEKGRKQGERGPPEGVPGGPPEGKPGSGRGGGSGGRP